MIIHKSITVARPADVAFKIFVEEIGQWWPTDKYSFIGPEANVIIEPRKGGRFYETAPDGNEYVIGEVLVYEPGSRLTVTWTGNVGSTEIDIRFTADGSGTRIDLAHSGWEKLAGGEQASAGYSAGWDEILGLFVRHADATR
jgi:uncharacterized protein YndB with AHSA1/START domain